MENCVIGPLGKTLLVDHGGFFPKDGDMSFPIGTPEFVAQEIWFVEPSTTRKATASAALFTFASVVYELITTKTPYGSGSDAQGDEEG